MELPSGWPLSLDAPRLFFTGVAIIVVLLAISVAIVRPRGPGLIVSLAGGVLALSWFLAVWAESADFRDADGWSDCSSCSALQTATGVILTYGAVALAVVGIGNFVILVRGFRARHHKRNDSSFWGAAQAAPRAPRAPR